MPLCRVCSHPDRATIDAALVEHAAGYRVVAGRFGLAPSSVQRHQTTHLRETIQQHEELAMLANTKSLVAELNRLQDYVTAALAQGVMGGDYRLVLLGVAQGRGNVETLARLGPLTNLEQRVVALEDGRATPNGDGA